MNEDQVGVRSEPVRVFLVDDHSIVRTGLRTLLAFEPDLEVVGEAGSGREALEQLEAIFAGPVDNHPGIVLMDLMMEDVGGIEATEKLKERWPSTEVLVLSMANDPAYLRQAFRAGVSGYVLKEAANQELVEAIRTVAEGGKYLTMSMAAKLAKAEADAREQRNAPRGLPLSKRECEVVRLVALGFANREIAEQLYISVRTVETHRMNIKQKTGLRTRADLVRFAREAGLVEAP